MSPKELVNSRQKRKLETRAALKRAALDCFAEQGFRATQVGDIARRAGVAHGTFYVHFETKEALVDDLLAEFNHQLVLRLERAYHERESSGPDAIARRLAEVCLDHWKRERELLGALTERVGDGGGLPALRDGISPPVAQFLADRLTAFAAAHGTVLSEPELVAHALLGMWMRVGLRYVFGEKLKRADAVELLTRLSLGALGAVLPIQKAEVLS